MQLESKKKYVTFDLGNVIFSVYIEEFLAEIKNLTGYSKDKCLSLMRECQGQMDLGLTNIKQFYTNRTNWRNLEYLVEKWDQIIQPEPKMMALIQELKEQGWQVGILSNIGVDHLRLLRKKYPEFLKGCVCWFSSEVGAKKPTSLFFQSFLQMHPEFRGCHYFDDLDENLYAAEDFGFQTRWFALDSAVLTDQEILKIKEDLGI